MSRISVSTPQNLPPANATQHSLRLSEVTLPERIKTLREIARSLLAELESMGSLATPEPEQNIRLDDQVKRFEIALIRAALVKTNGNQARAACLLGVKHTTLNSKIKRYRIQETGPEFDFPGAEQELVA
jgi:transcriptional regulator with GAF, ATPase, and Fis domain